MSATQLPIYRTPVEAAWIDYNGHLRDGYYSLIFSAAVDDLMDRLGIDARYRAASGNTLYTLEMHLYFLHEVEQSDALSVTGGIVNADQKRIHAAFAMHCARFTDAVATAEFMLLHVHQGVVVKSAPFPLEIGAQVDAMRALTAARPAFGAASRKIELR